jgi:hypothetical protein
VGNSASFRIYAMETIEDAINRADSLANNQEYLANHFAGVGKWLILGQEALER